MTSAQSYANAMQEPVVLYEAPDGDRFHMTLKQWQKVNRDDYKLLETLEPEPRKSQL